jgi:hypothetical protein
LLFHIFLTQNLLLLLIFWRFTAKLKIEIEDGLFTTYWITIWQFCFLTQKIVIYVYGIFNILIIIFQATSI